MSIYIFGYGSLINIKSISKTLRREIDKKEIISEVVLYGYERNWTLKENVFSITLNREITGIFLNVEKSIDSSFCNGVLFPVSESELDYLILREKNYDLVDISNELSTFMVKNTNAFLFSGRPDFLISQSQDNCYIMNRYIKMIEEGCMNWSNECWTIFNETTQKMNFPVLDGEYTFVDIAQKTNV